MVRVKICGITRKEDALVAVEAGADALGFMFYEGSKRYLSHEAARTIIDALPPFVARVGVFVNPTEEAVRKAIEKTGIDTLQFHGDETPDFCSSFRLKVIKAFRIKNRDSLNGLSAYHTDAWLLDGYRPNQLGGSGQTFDWNLAAEAREWGTPVILAGGLTPENVRSAVETARPYGVDVSSGVEREPGIKDVEKLKAFVAACRATDNL